MSERASSTEPIVPPPDRAAARESTQTFIAASSPEGTPPLSDDQPTVISNKPPLAPASGYPAVSVEAAVPPSPIGTAELGSQLDHFELLEYIGGGGMGRVYRAMDLGLGRQVALKILSREQARDPDTVARFYNEARSVARLNHESVAQVFYVGETTGMPFIAFEFVDGIDIRALVEQNGPLGLAEAVSYTLQIAEALAHSTEHRVVHRDVKPSNVLITQDGRAKLIDFGLARLRDPNEPGADLTASGVTLGTFDYISPEQARDPRNADERSDTYSLGCTLFYMLAGRPPFPEGTVLQKLLRHQGDEPPDIREFRPDVPEEVSRVLRKMMAKDPRRRYQDSARLIAALLILAEMVGLRPLGPGRRIWLPQQEPVLSMFQRHAFWLIPVAALIGIVTLMDAVWSPSGSWADQPPSIQRKQVADGAGVRGTAPAPVAGATTALAGSTSVAPDAVAGSSGSSPDVPTQAPGADTAGAVSSASAAASGSGPVGLEPSAPGEPSPAAGSTAAQDSPAAMVPSEPIAASPATASAEAPTVGGAATAATAVPRVLVVAPHATGENRFATLAAACAAARSDDVIELRFDGRQEEKPLELTGLRLTVRAASGYRPVAVFQPGQVGLGGPSRGMVSLKGSQLTASGVAWELNLPRDVAAADWSLFELDRAEGIRLDQCSLTIRKASDEQAADHQEVTFLRLRPIASTDVQAPDTAAQRPARTRIELADCIARGEATFLQAQSAGPWDLVWQNGLLVTTERMLAVRAAELDPSLAETNQVQLDHLTAVAQAGLCQFAGAPAGSDLPVTYLQCSTSILMASGAPLIEQVGMTDTSPPTDPIVWRGDRNFYEGFSYFRVMSDADTLTPFREIAFGSWTSPWEAEPEASPVLDQVKWRRLPDPSRPVHTHTPADYLLDETSPSNPALRAADYGRDAGLVAERLPPLPLDPVAYAPYNSPAWR